MPPVPLQMRCSRWSVQKVAGLPARIEYNGLCELVRTMPSILYCSVLDLPGIARSWSMVQTAAGERCSRTHRGRSGLQGARPVISNTTSPHAESFSNASSSLRTDTLVPIFFICVSSSFSPPARRISRSSIARIFFCRPLIFLALGFWA